MRKISAVFLTFALILSLGATVFGGNTVALAADTGYQSAEDVQYQKYTVSGKRIIANWGVRDEVCVFLSSYAEDYYTSDYTWDAMSILSGGTSTSNAPGSELYGELQDLMSSTHTFYTYYDGNKNVRDYYKYTDCQASNVNQVSLLYRKVSVSSQWDGGTTWNQEHVWPKSKLSTSKQIGDIMHLRPANPSENSSRGNTAYGEGRSYYDPGETVRGDCARMVLYMYVRWGVTGTMWGTSGVIQSLDILLKWMEEDPVDTWEMGRNDSVQSVTGVRNVFVDYPEYAWLLFGREIPEDMVTPSGMASEEACPHTNTQVQDAADATCDTAGYSGDTYCLDCGKRIATGSVLPATGEHRYGDWQIIREPTTTSFGMKIRTCAVCGATENQRIPVLESAPCAHEHTQVRDQRDADCTANGYSGDTWCIDCETKIATGRPIPATGHQHTEIRSQQDADCGTEGYSGDTWCTDCETKIAGGEVIPATGLHDFTDWIYPPGGDHLERHCLVCGLTEREDPLPGCDHTPEFTVTAAPTCTQPGWGRDFCQTCGEFLNEGVEIPATGHQHTEVRNQAEANCTTDGYSGDTWCTDCNTKTAEGEVIPATGHQHTEVRNQAEANCTTDGYSGDTWCTDCNTKTTEGEVIPATGHLHTEIRGQKDANCGEAGSTGDTYCTDCGALVKAAQPIPNADIPHSFGEWVSNEELSCRTCRICGHQEVEHHHPEPDPQPFPAPGPGPEYDWVAIGIAAAVAVIVIGGVVLIVIMKKKKR